MRKFCKLLLLLILFFNGLQAFSIDREPEDERLKKMFIHYGRQSLEDAIAYNEHHESIGSSLRNYVIDFYPATEAPYVSDKANLISEAYKQELNNFLTKINNNQDIKQYVAVHGKTILYVDKNFVSEYQNIKDKNKFFDKESRTAALGGDKEMEKRFVSLLRSVFDEILANHNDIIVTYSSWFITASPETKDNESLFETRKDFDVTNYMIHPVFKQWGMAGVKAKSSQLFQSSIEERYFIGQLLKSKVFSDKSWVTYGEYGDTQIKAFKEIQNEISSQIKNIDEYTLCEEGKEYYDYYVKTYPKWEKYIEQLVIKYTCSNDGSKLLEIYDDLYKDYLERPKSVAQRLNIDFSFDKYLESIKYLEKLPEQAMSLLDKAEREKLFDYMVAYDQEALSLIDANDRLEILSLLLDGTLSYFGTGRFGNSNAIVKLISSFNQPSEVDALVDYVTQKGPESDEIIYNQIRDKITDFMSDEAKTNLVSVFMHIAYVYNRGIADQNKAKAIINWEVEQKDYILFSYVNDKTDVETKHNETTGKITIKCLSCGNEEVLTNELSPFDLVGLASYKGITPFVETIEGELQLVPAMAIEYLNDKTTAQRWKNAGWNTLNIVATVTTLGEGTVALRSLRMAAGGLELSAAAKFGAAYKIADAGYTMANVGVQLGTDHNAPGWWNNIGYLFMLKGISDVATGANSAKKDMVEALAGMERRTVMSDDIIVDFVRKNDIRSSKTGQLATVDEYKSIVRALEADLQGAGYWDDYIKAKGSVTDIFYFKANNSENLISNGAFSKNITGQFNKIEVNQQSYRAGTFFNKSGAKINQFLSQDGWYVKHDALGRGELLIVDTKNIDSPTVLYLVDDTGAFSSYKTAEDYQQLLQKLADDGVITHKSTKISGLVRVEGRKVKITVPVGIGTLVSNLTGSLKATYDDLINLSLKAEEKANTILFKNAKNETVATIFEGKFTPTKWKNRIRAGGYSQQTTELGYIILKNGDDIAFDLGFKKSRVLKAEEANDYLVNSGRAQREGQPYLNGSLVEEIELNVGDKFYVVEYENVVDNLSVPNPGGFGTKESISTIKELREKLAVLEKWKDPVEDVLVIREYEVISPMRARTGTIDPQLEKTGVNAGITYSGGAHQYEFYDYLGNNNWKKFVKCVDDNGIKLK